MRIQLSISLMLIPGAFKICLRLITIILAPWGTSAKVFGQTRELAIGRLIGRLDDKRRLRRTLHEVQLVYWWTNPFRHRAGIVDWPEKIK